MAQYINFAAPEKSQANSYPAKDDTCATGKSQSDGVLQVGEERHSHWQVLSRRVRFVIRWIYWSAKHRSALHASWVCATEDLWW